MALSHYTPGFRLIDGDQLNDMVDVVNNLSGGGTAGPVAASTFSATGVASFAAGAVGAPSLTFTGDADTGIYHVGANSLALVANGVAQLTLTTTGIQGAIGATTPAAGAFTTVDGILGSVTPAAATVTALTASGASSLAALTASGTADLQGAVFALDNIETGITAHAGGTQGAAYALTKVISVISIVGTAADSVKLPAPTKVGQIAIIMNNAGANSLQVFGSGTDTVNGVATATGVAQAAGKIGLYVATTTGAAAAWFRLLSA